MYAKNLEGILALLCAKSDISHGAIEMADRFAALRDYGRLPRGRARRDHPLTDAEIAAAIFGLVSINPKWAGHAAIVLGKLRPVGGVSASFFSAPTLSDAIVTLLNQETARQTFARMTVTVAETGVNSNGGASILYQHDGQRRAAYYVPELAVSLVAPGREATFDPDRDRLCAPAMREMTFNLEFFRELANECRIAKLFPAPPEGDGSEYSEEEAKRELYASLGITPCSRFLNIGVENFVTWPKEATAITFDRYHLVLLPKTKDNVQSIHVDLTGNALDDHSAMTVINRFLSIMAWCDDNFAVTQGGWSGNPIPVGVPKRDLGFKTADPYLFDRKLPSSPQAMRALALYREARNAQHNALTSYAVLNYYKIIEIRNHGKELVKGWFRENFAAIRDDKDQAETIGKFLEACGDEVPHEYIHKSCRIAVAHANKYSKSDPDDAHEILRLAIAARVMLILARRFIENEFAVSDLMYSGN